MPKTEKTERDIRPDEGTEVSISEATDIALSLLDAIDIAKKGSRADILQINSTRFAIASQFKGENTDVHCTVCPDYGKSHLKIVND